MKKITLYFQEKIKPYSRVIFLVMFWLIAVNVFGLLALNRLNLKSDNAYKWIPIEKYDQHQAWNVVDFHSRWDSNWYIDLAKKGYFRYENDTLSNIVFFPLYPFLINIFSSFGVSPILVGWLVSSFFLFLSAVYLFKIVKDFHKKADPFLAVFLLLIFPTSFFLNAVYTESLFLFLSLATFYYTLKRKYALAAFIGFLASTTRITGILLFIPILIQLFSNDGFSRKSIKNSLIFSMIPLGTFLFFLFHKIYFGSFLLFFKVENAWGRSFQINAGHFLVASRAAISNLSLDIFYLVFAIFITGILVKKKQIPYAVYMLSTILVAVGSGTLMSIGRYILVLFPIFIIGASIKNELAKYIWITISLLLMTFNTVMFVNWYWAG